MDTNATVKSLTSAELQNNLHDIQDNVVTPIFMRYGRHLFIKFNDGAKGRALLRTLYARSKARQERHGTAC